MTRSICSLAMLAALASACTCAGPSSPAIESVTPAEGKASAATDVTVLGSGFVPAIQADLEHPASSTVRAAFALTLVRAEQRVPLEDVAFVSDRELSARIPPIPTPGDYDLELVDPRGAIAVLAAAFTVVFDGPCGPDGTPCDDGNVCTTGDTCQNGECAAGPAVCVNTAPRACLTVSPRAVVVGDPVAFDASCSDDGEDPAAALQARIDFDGDGIWDTPFAPITTVQEHVFPSAGLWQASVEVRDGARISDYASRYALVTAPGDLVLVTTAVDEDDPGATPGDPGGTGLSLREAIAWVDALGAPRTIRVAVTERIVHARELPPLTVADAVIVGDPAAPLEFPQATLSCITLDGASQLLLGATVTGCPTIAVQLGNASGESQVAECTIAPAPAGHGLVAKASGTIGPRNSVTGAATAVRLTGGSSFELEENRLEGNGDGVFAIAGVTLRAVRNRIASNRGVGLQATPSRPGACTLLHNVFDANGDDGVLLADFEGGLVARNNLFTRNGGWGIRDGSTVQALDHNGFFENARGALSAASPGPTDLVADPRYAGDHRLSPDSPAIDRGAVTELDVNGPAAGNYTGAAPDLGAWEAPYPAP